jgi:hypothetical protein
VPFENWGDIGLKLARTELAGVEHSDDLEFKFDFEIFDARVGTRKLLISTEDQPDFLRMEWQEWME